MSTSTITVAGQSVTLVSFPTAPGLKGYEFTISDKVGYVPSAFTGQMGQAQSWPGADLMSATLTIAAMNQTRSRDWIPFLMQLRGMGCAFQLGDVTQTTPAGSAAGSPQIDNTVSGNLAMSQFLDTKGWTPSAAGVLKRGDTVQVGYRLHWSLNDVDADASGKATFEIYPTIREQPSDGATLVTSNTKGLWRLAKNDRTFSRGIDRLTRGITLPIMEFR